MNSTVIINYEADIIFLFIFKVLIFEIMFFSRINIILYVSIYIFAFNFKYTLLTKFIRIIFID